VRAAHHIDWLAACLDVTDCSFRGVNGGIDVPDGAIAQPTGDRIVLLTGYIGMHLSQHIESSVQ
jgi:hypothetical protein